MIDLKLAMALHYLAAGVFLSSGVFLDFVLLPRLRLIPPDSALKLSHALARTIPLVSWSALVVLGITGAWKMYRLDWFTRFADPAFASTGPGIGMIAMLTLWVIAVGLQTALTFVLLPKVTQELPFDYYRRAGARDEAAVSAAELSRWAYRFQSSMAVVAVFLGAALHFGAF